MTNNSLTNGHDTGNSDKAYKTVHESLYSKIKQCHSIIYLILKSDFDKKEDFTEHFFNAGAAICDSLKLASRECEHLTAKDLMPQ